MIFHGVRKKNTPEIKRLCFRFESSYSHLFFRYRVCFDKEFFNIQANTECRFTLRACIPHDKDTQLMDHTDKILQ